MVFEERLVLDTYEEADNVARYLKSQKISSHIVSEPVFDTQLTLTGRYDAIIRFLSGYPDYIRRKFSKTREDERELKAFEPPDTEIWKTLPGLLESYRETAGILLEGVNQGDLFCQHLSDILNGRSGDGDLDQTRVTRDMEVFRILYLNQVVAISYAGATLTKKVSPDDLIYYIPWSLKFPPEEEVLESYQVTIVRCFSGKIRYVVIMGPEAVLHEDYQTLFYELNQKGVDADALFWLMDRHINKVRLVRNVVNDIMEGDTSIEDLKELYQDIPAVIEGFGSIQDRSDYSSEFIDEMVAELKKMDLIRGKDYRLRLGHLIYSRKIL